MAKQINWIVEKEAAQMVGYTDARSFRRNVKQGRFNVAYTALLGRNYQYNKADIEKLLLDNSSITGRV